MNMNTLTKEQLRKRGYTPITSSYLPCEQHMLDNVLSDMEKGNIQVILFKNAVWRKGYVHLD